MNTEELSVYAIPLALAVFTPRAFMFGVIGGIVGIIFVFTLVFLFNIYLRIYRLINPSADEDDITDDQAVVGAYLILAVFTIPTITAIMGYVYGFFTII